MEGTKVASLYAEISADASKFDTTIGEVQGKLSETKRQMEEGPGSSGGVGGTGGTGGSWLDKEFEIDPATGLDILDFFVNLGKGLFEAGKVGEENTEIYKRFLAESGSAAEAQANMNAMIAAAGDEVPRLELAQGAIEAMSRGLGNTPEELALLAQAASDLDTKNAEDFVASMRKLSEGLSGGRAATLDDFGIPKVELEAAIATVQKYDETLSKTEATQIATYGLLATKLQQMQDGGYGAAHVTDQVATTWENLVNEWQTRMTPTEGTPLHTIITGTDLALEGILELVDPRILSDLERTKEALDKLVDNPPAPITPGMNPMALAYAKTYDEQLAQAQEAYDKQKALYDAEAALLKPPEPEPEPLVVTGSNRNRWVESPIIAPEPPPEAIKEAEKSAIPLGEAMAMGAAKAFEEAAAANPVDTSALLTGAEEGAAADTAPVVGALVADFNEEISGAAGDFEQSGASAYAYWEKGFLAALSASNLVKKAIGNLTAKTVEDALTI